MGRELRRQLQAHEPHITLNLASPQPCASTTTTRPTTSGLLTDHNADPINGDAAAQQDRLLKYADQIRVGLTGNLKDYTFVDRTGATVKGSAVDYDVQHGASRSGRAVRGALGAAGLPCAGTTVGRLRRGCGWLAGALYQRRSRHRVRW